MDFYSTLTSTRAPAAHNLVGSVFSPDGQLRLGIPLQQAEASGSGTAGAGGVSAAGAGGAATSAGGVIVLMHPSRPTAENAPRVLLHLGIAADVAFVAVMLAELRWRSVQTTQLLATGAAGAVVAAVGAVGCQWRVPRLLELFATCAFAQFLICGLLAISLPQMLHCAIQPLLVWGALDLRGELMPLWFSTGRTRPSPTWPGMNQ